MVYYAKICCVALTNSGSLNYMNCYFRCLIAWIRMTNDYFIILSSWSDINIPFRTNFSFRFIIWWSDINILFRTWSFFFLIQFWTWLFFFLITMWFWYTEIITTLVLSWLDRLTVLRFIFFYIWNSVCCACSASIYYE